MPAFQTFRELQQCLTAKYWRRLLVCQKLLYSGFFNGIFPRPSGDGRAERTGTRAGVLTQDGGGQDLRLATLEAHAHQPDANRLGGQPLIAAGAALLGGGRQRDDPGDLVAFPERIGGREAAAREEHTEIDPLGQMQGEEPESRVAAIIDQQIAGARSRQMRDGQLMLAHAGCGQLGIDHQVVRDVVEDRGARQRRPARLLPEGTRQRLPARQTKARPVNGQQAKSLPQRCGPTGAKPLDCQLIQVAEHLLREPLAGLAEGRSARNRCRHRLLLHRRKETGQFLLGTALAQIEHERHQPVKREIALPRECADPQTETRDEPGIAQDP